jgi:hypothetical protein
MMLDYFGQEITPGLYIKAGRSGNAGEIYIAQVVGFTPKGRLRLVNHRWDTYRNEWRSNKSFTDTSSEMMRIMNLAYLAIPLEALTSFREE